MTGITLLAAIWAAPSSADTLTITTTVTQGTGVPDINTWTNVPISYGLRNQGAGGPWGFSTGLGSMMTPQADGSFWLYLENGYGGNGTWNSQIQVTITYTSDAPFPTEFGQLTANFTGGFTQGWLINEWVSVNGTIASPTISFYGGGVGDLTLSQIIDYGTGPYSVSATFLIYSEGLTGTGYGTINTTTTPVVPINPVPGPIVGAGIPGLMSFAMLMLARWRKRRH